MSSIKDVAKLAGVSISTVSNVLNQSRYVSPELIARVEEAVEQLSYEVNPIARSMKKNQTYLIGVITEDITGVFYTYVVKGINSIALEKGYQLIICDAQGVYGDEDAVERERELFRRLFASRVDGIIFVSAVPNKMKKNYIDIIKKMSSQYKKIPIVSIERDFSDEGIDSVYFDALLNAKTAVSHLVDCGCKKICHITGPVNMQIAQERILGYKECLKENHMKLDPSMICYGDYTHQSGYVGMEQLLLENPDLDGVFCGNDQMAIGALRLLREQDIRVPEDVKLIGYDDIFISSIITPALSTIHIKKRHTGIEAAKLLFDRIENPDKEHKAVSIKMEGDLVIRNSTVADAQINLKLLDW